jgi:hypothetical protein
MNNKRITLMTLLVVLLVSASSAGGVRQAGATGVSSQFSADMPGHQDAPAMQPLAQALNPDGTINTQAGVGGSFDPAGWKMDTSATGAPRFVKAGESGKAGRGPQPYAPGDQNWSSTFGVPGANNSVHVIAVSGSDVYMGGYFTTIGGIGANHIAKWNGSSWSALGSGTDNVIYTMAISGSDLYVGGEFTTAGGIRASHIAKWNGSSWSALGSGVSGLEPNTEVRAIATIGLNVYAGGVFTTAGGISANHIAKWNGSSWSALSTGLQNGHCPNPLWCVTAMATDGSNVYVAGNFAVAGGVAAVGIARWDGTNWFALGSGLASVSNLVAAISVSGGDVYVGGQFTMIGGISAHNIAKWNGSSWSALGSGVNDTVSAISVGNSAVDSYVYVGGYFTTAGATNANHIAKWNNGWSALGSGTDGSVHALGFRSTAGYYNLYVGGDFATAGLNASNNIALWHKVTIFGHLTP